MVFKPMYCITIGYMPAKIIKIALVHTQVYVHPPNVQHTYAVDSESAKVCIIPGLQDRLAI